MTINSLDNDPRELLDMLRFCAHQLLLAYGETLQCALWDASKKTAEACQSLQTLIQEKPVTEITTYH